jgi:hypothetical protein
MFDKNCSTNVEGKIQINVFFSFNFETKIRFLKTLWLFSTFELIESKFLLASTML